MREHGYSPDVFFDFSIGQDLVNSSWRTIYLDQPGLGLSREYLIKGMEEERVQHYFDYMQNVSFCQCTIIKDFCLTAVHT